MDLAQALDALKKAGTEPERKAAERRGARGASFGVAESDLDRLAKRIGKDPALAEALWRTGNHDAKRLALRVDDAASAPPSRLEARARDLDRPLAEALATRLAAGSPHAESLAERWIRDAGPFVAEAGWHLVAALGMRVRGGPSESWFRARLLDLDAALPRAEGAARPAMVTALCAAGSRSDALEAEALAIARRAGSLALEGPGEKAGALPAETAVKRLRAAVRARGDPFGMRPPA
jgi:hypothetical protein